MSESIVQMLLELWQPRTLPTGEEPTPDTQIEL